MAKLVSQLGGKDAVAGFNPVDVASGEPDEFACVAEGQSQTFAGVAEAFAVAVGAGAVFFGPVGSAAPEPPEPGADVFALSATGVEFERYPQVKEVWRQNFPGDSQLFLDTHNEGAGKPVVVGDNMSKGVSRDFEQAAGALLCDAKLVEPVLQRGSRPQADEVSATDEVSFNDDRPSLSENILLKGGKELIVIEIALHIIV